jgi:Spy/CpxP family protein refolding chaperone
MRRFSVLSFIFVSLFAATVAVRVMAQNAPGDSPPQDGGGPGGGQDGGGGGPGDPGNGPPPPGRGGYHLIPRFAQERLNLTDDQQQQINQLEKDTKAKLAKILTPDQMKILETARPPRPPRGGPDDQQGGPGGGPGGGGQGGGDQGPPN